MTTRVEIKHAIGDAIEAAVPDVTVLYTHEITDIDKALPAVLVYFDAVDVEEDLKGSRSYRADVVVSVLNRGLDDEIEPLVDAVIEATDVAIMSPNPLGTSWTLARIEYDRDLSPGIMQVTTSFSLWYN